MSDVQKDLETWLHSQEEWLQEVAERLATTGEPLTDADIDAITALLKTPEGRTKTSHRKFPQLVHGATAGSNVRLVSIGNVEGIDRLAPRTPLSFGAKPLCVIYGHNGSGKSGYTRILARASGKPRAVALRSNAYAPKPAEQKCTITYAINGVEAPVEWNPKSGPIDDLRCIDIFDTDTAEHYLSQETTASYSPPAVTVLERLAKTCDRINARLQEEQDAYRSTLPRIPSHLKDTDVACAYGGLNANTPPEEVQRLTSWTQSDEDLLGSLTAALKATDPATEATASQNSERFTRKLLEDLHGIASALSGDGIAAIREARASALTTRTIAQEAVAAAAGKAMIEGVGTETWKALWRAAREYSQTPYPNSPFPHTESEARCVLCHQEIAIEAAQRLAAFEAFTQGKVSTAADLAEQAYKRALESLPMLPTLETVAEKCHAAQLPAAWAETLNSFMNAAAETIKVLRQHEDHGTAVSPDFNAEMVTALNAHAGALEERARSLTSVIERDAKAATEKDFAELSARKWAAELRSEIEAHVANKRSASSLEALKETTSSRAVSYKAREVAKELINTAYATRFNSELSALGAQRIRVELVPTRVEKGTSFLQLRLKDSTTAAGGPDAVLSEGERRVVALAAFLADVTAGPSDTPFVFDDPITSLDHDYEDRVVSRLCGLSDSRQVVVLTHRMTFLTALTSHKFKTVAPLYISGRGDRRGDPEDLPMELQNPDEALESLVSKHLRDAKQALAESGESAYRHHAKAICSDLRIVVERLIEKKLLFGVVERHKRKLTTQDVIDKLPLITTDDCDLLAGFMTKYSYFEHSQPDESPVRIPDPEELAEDCGILRQWITAFNKKAKGK